MTTRFQYPVNFLYNSLLIRHEIKYTITDHNIRCASCYRYIFNIALAEFYIIETAPFSIKSCFFKHGRGEINPYNFTGFSCLRACNKCIIAGTATKINYYITFFDFSELCW